MAAATILANESVSSTVAVPEGHVVSGVKVPAAWDAAGVTFQAGVSSAVLGDLYNTAGEVAFASDAKGRDLVCSPHDFAGIRFLAVRSGTAALPVAQSEDRVLEISFRPLH